MSPLISLYNVHVTDDNAKAACPVISYFVGGHPMRTGRIVCRNKHVLQQATKGSDDIIYTSHALCLPCMSIELRIMHEVRKHFSEI